MKKIEISIYVAAIALLVTGAALYFGPAKRQARMAGGPSVAFTYNTTTSATSSIGTYTWTTAVEASSNRGYVTFCNENVVANSAIFLRFGATSTVSSLGMTGYRVPSGECYEMTQEKMFYGTIYAIASSSTSTLSTVISNY